MALAFADRVKETTTTTGTGTITLAGASAGYQSFAAIGNGNTTYYTIAAGTEWEVGVGTYTAAGTTLSRDTVLASSNGGALVNFSVGTKDVFCDYPAGKAVIQDANDNVGIGTSSPGAKLDTKGLVRSSIGTGTGAGGAGYAFYQFGTSTTATENWHIGAEGDGTFRFYNQGLGAGLERIRITAGGNVGIGTSSPGAKLDVSGGNFRLNGTSTDTYTGIINYNTGASGSVYKGVFYDVHNENGVPVANMLVDVNTDGSSGWSWSTTPAGSRASDRRAERMRITAGGEVYIAGSADQGAYNLQVNGTGVWGAGAYVNGSDRNLKEEIAPLGDALAVINALRPVTFRYKQDYSKDQSTQPGFIAQEMREALAGQVYTDGVVQAGPRYLNVAYQALIPVLVKAVQELAARVAELEGK